MPAVNPRITITLRPELHAVLKRLSALTGNSQSAIVGELLDSSFDVFERMAQTLDYAEKVRAEGMAVPGEVKRSLDRAQTRMEKQLGLALDDYTEGMRPLLEQAEKVTRRAGRQAPGAQAKTVPRAPVVPSGPYSAINPATGDRVLLDGQYFRKDGSLSAPISNRGVTPTTAARTANKRQAKKGGV